MTFTKNIGMILLAIYLLLVGLTVLVGGLGVIPPVVHALLAILAGVFILLGR